MSILAVLVVSSASVVASATIAFRNVRRGNASARDLWLFTLCALGLAALLAIYLLFWSVALGGDLRELLLPDLFVVSRKRPMLTVYALASAGLATGAVAMIVGLIAPRRKA